MVEILVRSFTIVLAALSLTACEGCSDTQTSDEGALPPIESAGGDIPSCYESVGLADEALRADRSIFIFVDQTTGLDNRLRETVRTNLERFLRRGGSFTIATFSAADREHYVTTTSHGTLEAPIPERDRSDLSVRKLETLDGCLTRQKDFAVNLAGENALEAMNASSDTFANSEIMASLKQLSEAVRTSDASDKVVIVVSDLLEHSSSGTFYENRNLREIDAEEQLAQAEANDLLGDFGGARILVVGAGLVAPESEPQMIRDTARLARLRRFWEGWFERSNANLTDYGQPDLMTSL